jgi:hypothetical protein
LGNTEYTDGLIYSKKKMMVGLGPNHIVYISHTPNHCEQFFRGQRTVASDRIWVASYHLRGAAQTWYYVLEQDEGMLT